ncbi:MAG: serine/threonine protein kinase [Actinobacteria bacterium]|nr:serine/threonine protein kinase [Actinomycetota bacterium]
MNQRIAERYELEDVVGTGGMASVYCAYDTLLERKVALKILHEHYSEDDEYVERFRREARAAAQLSHPGIVTVIDRGEEDGRQFIVFEYVEGETLKEVVERGGPMPVRRVLELGLEISRAIGFAHQQGLVHRDVKPQNVLLSAEGRAKVTDFGIARSIDAVGQTETGTVLGTSHYIAPEQARGERVDAQTDVYSFGVVLYELLVGDVPYPGDNFLNVAMRHVNDPVPSVLERRPDCPLRLASLVERMMAKEPPDRPASMDEVVGELEACRAELDARPDGDATMILKSPVLKSSRRRPGRPPRSGRGLLVLLPLAAVAAAAAAFFLTRDGDGNDRAADAPVRLQGVGAFDPPPGDSSEHDDEAGLATDGDPATFWRTENYRAPLDLIGKDGVGLVLDSGSKTGLSRITVTTDTPGFTAEIKAGDSPRGPFETVGGARTAGETAAWQLDGPEARYYLVWITELDGVAHVNEVKAS